MNTRSINSCLLKAFLLSLSLIVTSSLSIAGLMSNAKGTIQDREPKLVLPARSASTTKPSNRFSASGVASTYTVINTNDAGAGSLRQAIIDANANSGADLITFSIPGAGVHIIAPTSNYDVITEQVTIDGWSQPGFSSTPLIEIDGISVIGGIGLNIQASNCVVRGLAITRFQQFPSFGGNGIGIGIFGEGTTNVWIYGNHIGVDASGTVDRGNAQIGIWIGSGANGQTIGTDGDGETDAAERNIVSGNDFSSGMLLQSNNNTVAGNYIGTDITATVAIKNDRNGVRILNASGNTVGGTIPAARNVISGNGTNGVLIQQPTSTGNIVEGNFIGTDVTGTVALSNLVDGVIIANCANNTVGGTTATQRNIISGNGVDGLAIQQGGATGNIVEGNFIGTDVTGTIALSNKNNGISIYNGATYNTIGGTTPGSRNIIAGSNFIPDGWGLLISRSSANTVQGNYIGTDINGTSALSNGVGVVLTDSATNNIIGGTASGAGNLISGNNGYVLTGVVGNGIALGGGSIIGGGQSSGRYVQGNSIQGNYIGTDFSGNVSIPNTTGGIVIRDSANHNTVGGTTPAARNVISGNTGSGVEINGSGTTGNTVLGNYIGTNASGTAALANGTSGVFIIDASTNTIGGTTANARNVISGNNVYGVRIEGSSATGNLLQGNFIGTDVTGNSALANFNAVYVYNAPNNTIGGTVAGAGNVISGNGFGLAIAGSSATGNKIQRNLIGTDATGTVALGNIEAGVAISFAYSTTIGGGSSNARNIISGNIGDGILIAGFSGGGGGNIIQNNFIGTQIDGTSPLGNTGNGIFLSGDFEGTPSGNTIGGDDGRDNTIAFNGGAGIFMGAGTENTISANSIYQNTGLGIDLNGDGVSANDAGDGDGGANNTLNYPVLDFAASDLEGIAGSIHSDPSSILRIEFFRSSTVDPSGYGEGETYLGSTSVTTDVSGDGSFFVTFPGQLTPGQFVTATSTDPDGNTSEFSGAVTIAPKVKAYGDHYVVNTTVSGIPLHWPDGKTNYVISNSVPGAFTGAITNGLAPWDALSQLQYTNAGATASTNWGGNPDTINNMVWISSNWEGITGADSNVIAVTRVRYNSLTGEVTDADIGFDAQHFSWDTSNDTSSLNMNIENVTTHEAGHFSGLGDIYEPGQPQYVSFMGSGNKEVTMFGFIKHGEIKKESLEAPDSAGIKYIYDHIPQARMDLVLVFDGSATFASTFNGLTPSKNASTELINKMRVGDRIGVVRLPNTNALPLMEITDQASRNTAAAAISGLTAGGASAIGSGLQTGESMLEGATPLNGHGKAMILFSAGEEDTTPPALSSLGPLLDAGTMVFTMGFQGSSGQSLSDSIASKTRGAYYLARDTTIGTIVDRIWSKLIGEQALAETVITSNNIPGFPQPGIRWQGAVDPGTSGIEPGIRWQGSNFGLSLIAPDNAVIDSPFAASNPTDGIEFFSGPTFSFYRIKNPTPGLWTLIVQGRVFPPNPEPVNLYILASTDLTMDVAFNKGIYKPDEQIDVTTTLSRGGSTSGDVHVVGGTPVTDATVVADVLIPGTGVVQTLNLTHAGNGIYKGSFHGTHKSGSYKFDVRASKTDDFNRLIMQSVFVVASFTCPPNMVVNATPGQCSAIVNYSIVPGDPLVFPGLTVVCTPPPGSTFPVGTTTVTCIGSDAVGHRDTSTFAITVKDNQPPTVSGVSANPNVLTPPDHKMRDVTITYTTSDNCGPVSCVLSVTSNERVQRRDNDHDEDEDCEDHHDTAPDWIIIDAHHVKLRAERRGRGTGRIYTITITCTDASGNQTTNQVMVTVPKPGKKHLPKGDRVAAREGLPAQFAVDQNYPNPFNPTTQIQYALPTDSRVSLKIYNTLGEVVRTLVDNVQEAGYQVADFDASTVASGVYFYRLEASSIGDPGNSFTQVRKMLVLK